MRQALTQAAELQRKSVRHALQTPAVGATLLAITQWLEALPARKEPGDAKAGPDISLRRWARQRITRLHKKMKQALKDTAHPDSQHRARILSKRLRYGVEALRPLLPRRQAERWHARATALQTGIGAARDLAQAGLLAARFEADPGLAEFLRGVAAGQPGPR